MSDPIIPRLKMERPAVLATRRAKSLCETPQQPRHRVRFLSRKLNPHGTARTPFFKHGRRAARSREARHPQASGRR